MFEIDRCLPGKAEWRPLLSYTADLHRRCMRTRVNPFPYDWEEIGTGYCYAPSFGHWDIIHQVLDMLKYDHEHSLRQIENYLALQRDDGMLPGCVTMRDGLIDMHGWRVTHPPVWIYAVDDMATIYGTDILSHFYPHLVKQIQWFVSERRAGDGYFYTDILNHTWESGVDEGIRFDTVATGALPCVDATAHVFGLLDAAARWSRIVGMHNESAVYKREATAVRDFMRSKLFDEETGFFHDYWAIGNRSERRFALEGMWPMVVGAASDEQAQRVIDENLLNPERFFTRHPLASVGKNDDRFELRMWRGPTWNSMTYWAARGAVRYGRGDAACSLLERALDSTTMQFERTGTIWEFYHPHGGMQMDVIRKPKTPYNLPCSDYLGHNPLIAMAMMWDGLHAS